MTPQQQGRILDVLKGSVATAALFLAFFYLPVVGMLIGLFAAAPGTYYTLKHGRPAGVGLVALAAALLAAVAGPAAGVVYLLQGGAMSLALAEFLLRHKGGARAVVYSVALNLALIVVSAVSYTAATGGDLHAQISQGVMSSTALAVQIYQKLGVTGDDLKLLQESLREKAQFIVTIYPALLTVALGSVAALNLMAVARAAARNALPVYLGDFRKYKNPEPLVWVLIAAGFGMLVPQQLVHLVCYNLLIVVGALYAVQGVAVISHFFRKYSVPGFIRVLGCLLLIFQPPMVLAVAVLGIFDLWGDFRSPDKQENL